MAGDVVSGPQKALPFLLAQGMPAQLRVIGASMEPTFLRGAVLNIVPVAPSAELAAGDVVVLASRDGNEVIVHRVLLSFVERGSEFVVHQGDAPGTAFGVAARQQVLARATSVDGGFGGPRPIGAGSLGRFALRRLLCLGYVAARRLASATSRLTRAI